MASIHGSGFSRLKGLAWEAVRVHWWQPTGSNSFAAIRKFRNNANMTKAQTVHSSRIVTAAHCVSILTKKTMSIVLGEFDISSSTDILE